jgi:hypothetical protein
VFERQPQCSGVHLVLWQFELSGAYVLIREEFDFLESDDLRIALLLRLAQGQWPPSNEIETRLEWFRARLEQAGQTP